MKEEIKRIRSVKRRDFFANISKGIAGLLLLNAFPLKAFTKKKSVDDQQNKNVKIKIHPMAVKRNNKG